jgi:hypothetical protein
VMGHSHRPVDQAVGNGTRYFNLGSWTPGRSTDGFPHVAVVGGSAELRRWRGPPVIELQPSIPPSIVPVPA